MTKGERFLLKLSVPASVGAFLLYRYPPETTGIYPQCPIHAWTGLLCPGCGTTRALAALLHGRWGLAWNSNGLIVALLPILAAYLALALRRMRVDQSAPWPEIPRTATDGLLVLTAIFTVARNLR